MTIYRLHVSLIDVEPLIWRRVDVFHTTTLAQLHQILQAAMGWGNSHLHEFEVGEERYGEPDPEDISSSEVLPEADLILANALPSPGDSLLYTYDFGDGWEHEVLLEEIVALEHGRLYPYVLDGARSCPPEDCGGPAGYANLLDVLARPKHKEYRHLREWVGKQFDPERFSADEANSLLSRRLRGGKNARRSIWVRSDL